MCPLSCRAVASVAEWRDGMWSDVALDLGTLLNGWDGWGKQPRFSLNACPCPSPSPNPFGRFGDLVQINRTSPWTKQHRKRQRQPNRRGYLSRDVRLSVPLIVVNPKYDMRKVGFETIKRMQKFGRQNAVSSCHQSSALVEEWICQHHVCLEFVPHAASALVGSVGSSW